MSSAKTGGRCWDNPRLNAYMAGLKAAADRLQVISLTPCNEWHQVVRTSGGDEISWVKACLLVEAEATWHLVEARYGVQNNQVKYCDFRSEAEVSRARASSYQ